MDERGIFLTGVINYFLPCFIIIWFTTIFGILIGCSKKKPAGGGKKVGESAASYATPNLAPGKSPTTPLPNTPGGGGAGAGNGVKPLTTSADNNNNKNTAGSADTKNTTENNKDDKKDDKKPDEKHEEKPDEKKEDEKKDDEKKEDDKKESKKEDDKKKKEPSNKEDVKKKSEKPNGGEKKDAASGFEKASCKPELSTNRTQLSKSVKVKDDDDTVKHIESLKEDKEKSE